MNTKASKEILTVITDPLIVSALNSLARLEFRENHEGEKGVFNINGTGLISIFQAEIYSIFFAAEEYIRQKLRGRGVAHSCHWK